MSTLDRMREEVVRREDIPVTIEITGEADGKVILPIGVVGGVGARSTSVYLAQVLAEANPMKRVLHVDMNITSPGIESYYFPDPSKIQQNLDQIYQEVKKGVVTGKQIEDTAIVSKRTMNIYIIPGTNNHLVAEEFDDRVLQAIIKAARQHFHYIVISAAADLDNPGTVAALLEADHIWMCSSGDLSEVKLLNQRLNFLFRPQIPSLASKMKCMLIDRDPSFKDAVSQLKTTDLPMVGVIPFMPGILGFKHNGGIIRGKQAESYLEALEGILRREQIITDRAQTTAQANWFSSLLKRKEA